MPPLRWRRQPWLWIVYACVLPSFSGDRIMTTTMELEMRLWKTLKHKKKRREKGAGMKSPKTPSYRFALTMNSW